MLEVVASMRGAARAARREARRERAALVSRLAAEARVALSSEMLLSWWACEAAYFEAASHGRVLLPSPFWSPPPRVSLFKPSNSQGLGVPKTSQSGSPLFRIHILTPPYANRLAFSEWKSELTHFVSLDHCVQCVEAVIAKSTGTSVGLNISPPPFFLCVRILARSLLLPYLFVSGFPISDQRLIYAGRQIDHEHQSTLADLHV